MANKRYYWLRLKEDFFKSKEMKKLRRIAGGDTYTIIYLKMQLASIKNDGVLHYDGLEDAFYKELALDIDEDEENVKVAVAFLTRYGLLITQDDIEFSMPLVRECIGSETSSTIRSRRYRDKQKALQCNTCATLPSRRDRDRDREKEKHKARARVYDFSSCTQNELLLSALRDFAEMRKAIKKPLTNRAGELILSKLEKMAETDEEKIAILNQSVENSLQVVFPLKNQQRQAEAEPQIDYEEKRQREREACKRRDAENAALMAEQMGWNK